MNLADLQNNNTTINNKNSNEVFDWMPYKWLPTPDRFVQPVPMGNVGGFAYDTHGNVHRGFDYSSFTVETNGFGVSAYQIQFGNGASISCFSRTGSTSGYWNHAITYLMGYNDTYRHFNFQDGTLSGMEHIVVLNMGRKDYGDRIKLGSLNIEVKLRNTVLLRNYLSISSISSSNVSLGSTTSQLFFPYFYPYFSSNNESLIYTRTESSPPFITPNYVEQGFAGKLFPYDGLAIISTTGFSTSAEVKTFIDKIDFISWDTDITTTEFHAYCIKDPFILNNTTNPTIFKTSLCALTANVGYSYGRDGLTGNSGEFIDSISSISTYASTIGLYNDLGEMLFVAKLPQAIKLVKELPYSFLVSVDYRIK